MTVAPAVKSPAPTDEAAPAPRSAFSVKFDKLRSSLRTRLSRRGLRDSEVLMIMLCAPLGAAVGLVDVVLHMAVTILRFVALGISEDDNLSSGFGIDHARLVIMPVVGGVVLGAIAFAARKLRMPDIVDPIEANAIHGGRMSILGSVRLAGATILSNGVGASVGMEAAYTQMGAGLLSSIAQALRLRREDQRIFVAAGAAAAIAVAFNAPLAGAFYGYELVLGSYAPAALAQVAMAALTGTLVARAFQIPGIGALFTLSQPLGDVPRLDYGLFALLGLASGMVGIGAMRAVTWCESGLRRLKLPFWARPAIGGLAIAGIGWYFPQALGSGRGAIQWSFDTMTPLPVLAGLVVAKLVASSVSIGSGFRGGLFSASLLLGCLFGALAAQTAEIYLPMVAGQREQFMLVGMGAMAAAIIGAPVTMVLLVLEATGYFDLALAVLAGVVTASTLVRVGFGYSFATWRFHQRGVAIRGGHDVGWLSELTVGGMMRGDPTMVLSSSSLIHLRETVPLGGVPRVFVADGDGRFTGGIDVATIHDPSLDDDADGLVADDLADGRKRFLLPGQNIREALNRFSETEQEMLPVLSAPDRPEVVGYLTEAFALRRYAEELERHRNAELGLRSATDSDISAPGTDRE